MPEPPARRLLGLRCHFLGDGAPPGTRRPRCSPLHRFVEPVGDARPSSGAVDLTQSEEQLSQWWPEERRAAATELEVLGEFDPLVVEPVQLDRNGPDLELTRTLAAA
jgi:hypothetical protein